MYETIKKGEANRVRIVLRQLDKKFQAIKSKIPEKDVLSALKDSLRQQLSSGALVDNLSLLIPKEVGEQLILNELGQQNKTVADFSTDGQQQRFYPIKGINDLFVLAEETQGDEETHYRLIGANHFPENTVIDQQFSSV